MKPYELFQTFELFKSVMEGSDVPPELKLKVAQEFKASLSPLQYSAACPTTRQWLENAVQNTIDTLQQLEKSTQDVRDTYTEESTHTKVQAIKGKKKVP